MKYGQLQYYTDELNQWSRISMLHKCVLDESLRQLNVMLSFPVVPLPTLKVGNALMERVSTQKKRADALSGKLAQQKRCLQKVIHNDYHESYICEKQKRLRAIFRNQELKLIKTTSECSMFLSSFFDFSVVPAN